MDAQEEIGVRLVRDLRAACRGDVIVPLARQDHAGAEPLLEHSSRRGHVERGIFLEHAPAA